MNPVKISITGDLGSGKSTVAKILSGILNCKQYSTGSIQREIAKKMNISTLDLNEAMKHDSDIDSQIDEFNKSLNKSENDFVIDSRMAITKISASESENIKIRPNLEQSCL